MSTEQPICISCGRPSGGGQYEGRPCCFDCYSSGRLATFLSQQPTREEGDETCTAPATTEPQLDHLVAQSTDCPQASNAQQTSNPDAAATPRRYKQVWDKLMEHPEGEYVLFTDYQRELSADTARREEAERGRLVTFDDLANSRATAARLRADFETANNAADKFYKEGIQLHALLATIEKERDAARKEAWYHKKAFLIDWGEHDDLLTKAGVEKHDEHEDIHTVASRIVLLTESRDEAESQRAQSEAKVRELEEKFIEATNYAACAYCKEKIEKTAEAILAHMEVCQNHPMKLIQDAAERATEMAEINKGLDSALTTERRAREQSEADATTMRKAWMQLRRIAQESIDSPDSGKSIWSHKIIERCDAAIATDSGKPLFARLEKAEADVKRLRWIIRHAKAPNWKRDWPMLWKIEVYLNASNHDGEEPDVIKCLDAAMSTEETR